MFVPIPGRPVGQVGVALGAPQELPDDQQRPPLPDQRERMGHRAVLVVVLGHQPDTSGKLSFGKGKIANCKRVL